jgi:hypothetical protein
MVRAGFVGSGVALAGALSCDSSNSVTFYGVVPAPDCGPDVFVSFRTFMCPTDASLDAPDDAPEDAADATTTDASSDALETTDASDAGQPDAPIDAPLDVSAPHDASHGG